MTTYSIREAKAHLSEILRDLDHGDEVIITRRGRPCGRLTAVDAGADDRPSLSTLRGALSQLPTLATIELPGRPVGQPLPSLPDALDRNLVASVGQLGERASQRG